MPESERLSFEEALKKLQNIVSKLEDESISLEDSVDLYEEGIKLSKYCTEALEKAELKIKKVTPDDQEPDK